MNSRLLATKLHIPPRRNNTVVRTRLSDRLNFGLQENIKLALISAPAGYGKTTLVTDWLHSPEIQPRIAWLSLEVADNDPARFLEYWISALQTVDATIGQAARSLLSVPQIPSLTVILDEILNELSAMESRIYLVMDDYQVISRTQIHEAMEYFLEHQPPQIFLIITTRNDPPFPLARMRARGQMIEVRANDMRFTLEEACQFFNHSMHLELSDAVIQTLDIRTEGWVAGLQLAALALHNLPDQQDFLADFSGSHRYVIDYLLDEVLKKQPNDVREFLVKTSVLHRFNASLCQAVTDNPASIDILADLERSNVFLIPLDDMRDWYRYHTLFADAMRVSLEEADERNVHARAAAWFEVQEFPAEAIPHWFAIPQMDQAARLISRLAPDLMRTGEVQTLLGWLNTLPEAVVQQSPDLISQKALSLFLTGQIHAAREFIARASISSSNPSQQSGYGRFMALQAWFTSLSDHKNVAELSRLALEHLDAHDLFFRALVLLALGSEHAWNAELPDSSQVFHRTWEMCRQTGQSFVGLGALANLAFNLLEMGRLSEAEQMCRSAFSENVDRRGKGLPILGILHAPLAAICYEKGHFDEAQSLAESGIAICRRLFSNDIMGGDNEVTLARIAFEQGHVQKAFTLIQEAAQAAGQRDLNLVVYKMSFAQADLHLLQNNLAEAEQKIKEMESLELYELTKFAQKVSHLHARFLLATGQIEQAIKILQQLEKAESSEGALWRLMGIYITQAMAFQQQGDLPRARHTFNSALHMAEREGYRSLFLPHPGRPTKALLEAARTEYPVLIAEILRDGPIEKPVSLLQLPEPLSDQELRVLSLIIEGKSNQEIADHLVISLGTAKWHVHNVLQKLGAGNRAQAIARTRELGLQG